jgi:uroporphyrinogen-III synthase
VAACRAGLEAGRYRWLVLPSANAADLLLQALAAVAPLGDARPLLAGPRILCGAGTADWLAGCGLAATRSLARFSAAAALAALADEPGPFLVPRARDGREELVAGMRARGAAVDDPVLYATRPVAPASLAPLADLLRRGALHAATFTSPSTASGLLDGLAALAPDLLPALRAIPAACIGETTAGTLRRLRCTRITVARETTLASLVEAVTATLADPLSLVEAAP